MKHSQWDIKWFYRSLLLFLFCIATFIVTRQSYNIAHWVPHVLLRDIGLPYSIVLWGEQNMDKLLHFAGAAGLTWLIHKSEFPIINPVRALFITAFLCLSAECVQLIIGRGFNSLDLLLGISGSFMAYLATTKK